VARLYRSRIEREQDRDECMRLLLKGWTFTQIAQFQERSRQLVAHDIKTVEERWKQSAVINFSEARQRQLARLEVLEKTAWEAWERSCQPRSSTRDRRRHLPTMDLRALEDASEALASADGLDDDDSGPAGRVETEHTTRTEQRDGDPRFLERIAWCIQERSKLLGLYLEKAALEHEDERPVSRVVVYLPPDAQKDQAPVALPPAQELAAPSPPPNGKAHRETDLAGLPIRDGEDEEEYAEEEPEEE
jgi:hypothetical protein